MADALISPAVGGTLWAVSGGLIAFCARKVQRSLRDNLVPMMGVLGAFIFAAQMINFSIPGTGSSGHLGGGLLLAALLGTHAAFLVLASVLTVQAFFFADGGLLALGCNIFNLGFFPAFVAYPLLYRWMAKGSHGGARLFWASLLGAVVGLQLGAFSVVLETTVSGVSELPFRTFVLLMQPIHLAIGVVEGVVTATVVSFVARARPEAFREIQIAPGNPVSLRPVLIGLLMAAVAVGGMAGWFASTHPDGLEWAMARVSGREGISGADSRLHRDLATLQDKTAILPDYGFKSSSSENVPAEHGDNEPGSWPAMDAGTSVSGIVGGFFVLVLAGLTGFALKARRVAVGLGVK